MKPHVYISGRMTDIVPGDAVKNREAYMARFGEAERLLRNAGYWVINPTTFLPSSWPWLYGLLGYKLTLLYDLWRLSRCDYIYKIPGWRESRGANIESCWAFHFRIWLLPKKKREQIDLKMAKFIEKWEVNLNNGNTRKLTDKTENDVQGTQKTC